MKKTGAWLVRYALEQIGVRYTFGIPGVHNTELYDELDKSETITPILVAHEGGGSFMADAISRVTSSIGTLLVVPAAGITHAASGIGEAFLDGIPMLVLSGGVRTDSAFQYQLHDIDQHALLRPLTKKTWKIEKHSDIIPTLFKAYSLAISGEPGPVYVEIPVNIQLDSGEIDLLPRYTPHQPATNINEQQLDAAAQMLVSAKQAGLFLGWGAVHATDSSIAIAELLGAPAATTLQGLSAFPANHPLHTGMSFGPHSVPAAENAFKKCDCLLAVGTRFSEIATGSFGITPPAKIIHIDINPAVFNANYKTDICIQGDAKIVLEKLAEKIKVLQSSNRSNETLKQQIAQDKAAYLQSWFRHDSKDRVNPARFFNALRKQLPDDGFIVADDGNHTFLTAELMPIHKPRHFISPTDFNCMGYAVPATIATKLAYPEKAVVSIIGDGAFLMTGLEILTATRLGLGAIFTVFNDGELSQISQAQKIPYNKKTCTVLGAVNFKGIADATGADYIRIENNEAIEAALKKAFIACAENRSVILDVMIDYSKKTRFTEGIVGTNLKRLPMNTKVRMVSRALWRRVVT